MIRVVLVDDHTLVRQGIRSLLDLAPEIEVIGEADDGMEALAVIAEHNPDAVLLDLRMPRHDGLWTLRALASRAIEVPVLVLTTFDDDELVLAALRAGARGYMLKDVTLERLAEAIETVAAGATLVQPAITDKLLRAFRNPESATTQHPPVQQLTERERDVLGLVAGGYTNRQIAGALHLAEGTVKNHVSSVLFKLGARDRTDAALRALREGLFD